MSIDFTANNYIEGVLNGSIIACKWVKLACERHLRDLETGHERGLHFDEQAAKLVVAFFSLLKHSKGEWAGKPVTLEPWQQFHLWVLFGWKRADGTRRFRTSYLEVARKNGKSTLAAGIGLYLLVADGESGAEIYTAATKLDQAKIIHSEATRMVQQSPDLRAELDLFKNNINSPGTYGKYEPLGADSKTLDGLNTHAALIDEVHAHPNRDLWDVLRTSQGARRQPLMYAITTAGFDQQSLCFDLNRYTRQVLEQTIEDDSFTGLIFTIDEEDNWEDSDNWIKANPNLGISKKLSKMREEAQEAKNMPTALNSFLRLNLNVWTNSETAWLNPDSWKECGKIAVSPNALLGSDCYAGLDMSSTTDITAFVMIFPRPDGYHIVPKFWIPKDNIKQRVNRDRVPYDVWVQRGYIKPIEGNVIDYRVVVQDIEELGKLYWIKEIAFDRWGAFQISQDLDGMGFTMVPFGQGFASMNGPSKEVEKLVMEAKLAHGDNPVLNWMASNVVARIDPAGNIKPDKSKSTEKIDGIVALIMAMDRCIRNEGATVYSERGLLVL